MRSTKREGCNKLEEALGELAQLLAEDDGATVLIAKRLPDQSTQVINLREQLGEDGEEDNINHDEEESEDPQKGFSTFAVNLYIISSAIHNFGMFLVPDGHTEQNIRDIQTRQCSGSNNLHAEFSLQFLP